MDFLNLRNNQLRILC